jgi:hypothetical protein
VARHVARRVGQRRKARESQQQQAPVGEVGEPGYVQITVCGVLVAGLPHAMAIHDISWHWLGHGPYMPD